MKKNKGGRPLFDGKSESAVVAKLEQAFAIDATIEEACSHAEISRDAYYRYLENHPEFRAKVEDLRNKPILKARNTVVAKLGETYGNAMDYLKRKRASEFGDKVDATVDVTLKLDV